MMRSLIRHSLNHNLHLTIKLTLNHNVNLNLGLVQVKDQVQEKYPSNLLKLIGHCFNLRMHLCSPFSQL